MVSYRVYSMISEGRMSPKTHISRVSGCFLKSALCARTSDLSIDSIASSVISAHIPVVVGVTVAVTPLLIEYLSPNTWVSSIHHHN